MNILVEPFFIGIFQVIISILLFSGLTFVGRIINILFFKNYQQILLDLIVSIIIISQILKIIVYIGLFEKTYVFFSFILVVLGVLNIKNIFYEFSYKIFFFKKSKLTLIVILLLFLLFLISIAPPSMADALDYHYGIPLYILKYNEIPNINFWLYANVGGNGDIFNALALYLKTDNFVSFIQFVSILLFLSLLKKELTEKSKFIFISIFILSSPTILQLLSGPKFMLLPQIMTALALFYYIKNEAIKPLDFIFISILLMGAAQFKSSFIISGSLIGLLTFLRAYKSSGFKNFFSIFWLVIFFFLPTTIWNFNQILNFNFINIFSIMPDPMMENMKAFKENGFIYPLEIFIPSSLGKVSSVLGFQILILLMHINASKKFNITLYIIVSTIILHYFLGMNVGRMYYEFILWGSVAFIFSEKKFFNYNLFSFVILPQTILIIIFSSYFAAISLPSLFSNKQRDNFMINNTFYYEGIKWVNKTLPKNSKVISTIRSVSLLKNEFAPTDILDFNLKESHTNKYLKILKEKKFDFILIDDYLDNHVLKNCIGNEFAKSTAFKRATRNPFNSIASQYDFSRGMVKNSEYKLILYHFNYKTLPECFTQK
jgi:hypothetical protein